jgi:hypothetical protein
MAMLLAKIREMEAIIGCVSNNSATKLLRRSRLVCCLTTEDDCAIVLNVRLQAVGPDRGEVGP